MGSNSTEVGLDTSGHRASTLTPLRPLLLSFLFLQEVSTQKKAAFFCHNKQLLPPLLHGCWNCCFSPLRCNSLYSMLDFAAKADILFCFCFCFSFTWLNKRKISKVMLEILRLMGPQKAYPNCECVMGTGEDELKKVGATDIEDFFFFGHLRI